MIPKLHCPKCQSKNLRPLDDQVVCLRCYYVLQPEDFERQWGETARALDVMLESRVPTPRSN